LSRKVLFIFFISLILIYYIQLFCQAGSLPDKVISHYNLSGKPNGYSSREGFIIFQAIIGLIISLSFIIPYLIAGRLSDKNINLPNKEYWLAPERRAKTIDIQRIYFSLFGIISMIFIILLNMISFKSNTSENVNLGTEFFIIFGLFVIGIFYSSWHMYFFFKNKKI